MLAIVVVQDVFTMSALSGWLVGRVLDEVALLVVLSERLGRRRRQCDVGVETPVTASSTVALLHRQGGDRA